MNLLRSQRVTALFLAAAAFIVYNANARVIAAGDTLPARLLPFSILLDGAVTLDRFFQGRIDPGKFATASEPERGTYYYLASHDGRLYSKYPIALPILITPVYAPVVVVKREWSDEQLHIASAVMEKIVASLIAALSVAAMFALLTTLTDRRLALILTLAFAFGTTTWTTSSQALWQHGAGVLFMLLSLWAVTKRTHSDLLSGIFAAIAVAIRPSNILFWIALLVVDTWTRRSARRAATFALPGIIAGGLVAAYNLTVFGNLQGGYGLVSSPFDATMASGLAGILLSPSRGLLIYSPFLLAGFIGLWIVCRDAAIRRSPVFATAALFVISDLILIASFKTWWGGWSYGPRLLTEAAAVLVVLAVPAAEKLRGQRWARAAFVILAVYAASVQMLGAAAYSTAGGWNSFPVSVDSRPDRLWDWRDSQILRTARIP